MTRIDLGGIGKGYALDRAALRLRELGASRALLNFGGQILALDPPQGQDGWAVAILSPSGLSSADEGSIFAVEALSNISLACSGAMHRGAHILDPQTGEPATIPLLTAAYATDAMTADAWSTAGAITPDAILRGIAEAPALRAIGRLESAPLPAPDSLKNWSL